MARAPNIVADFFGPADSWCGHYSVLDRLSWRFLRMREFEKKMILLDHRLATILQIRTVLAVRMFELRQLRRRVQTAQLSPRRRRRVRSRPRF